MTAAINKPTKTRCHYCKGTGKIEKDIFEAGAEALEEFTRRWKELFGEA